MPLLIAIHDFRHDQRDEQPDRRPVGSNVHGSWLYTSFNGLARYILPAALLSCANFLIASLVAEPRSTYICQSAWFARSIVPIVQVVEACLDCYVLVKITALIKSRGDDAGATSNMVPVTVVLLSVVSVSTEYAYSLRPVG